MQDSDYCEFLKQELGANYVVARRTPRIIAKYGDDVNCVTPKQHATVTRKYRMDNGHEYNPARAGMYKALLAIHAHLASGDKCPALMQELARAALIEEQATF